MVSKLAVFEHYSKIKRLPVNSKFMITKADDILPVFIQIEFILEFAQSILTRNFERSF